jgi:hypothetical protein
MAQDFISAILGSPPDYSNALSPQQTQQMRSNALTQGGIGALIALLGASGQQPRPIGTGQALAGALGAGFGGYQSSFDNTLKQMLAAQQLGEYKQKQEARKRYEDALAAATTMQPQAIPMATGAGSQLEMLSRPEFGGDMASQEAIGAMRGNLPMTGVVDPAVANRAALDFLRQTDPGKFIELTTPKAEAAPASVKEYQFAQGQGYKGTFQQFVMDQSAAKAQKVTLDMTGGQKGFENEMKLKGEFKSEPVYKAYQEMQSAYNQITDSLKSESPAGDLAAATKFMKLLDPGSVVRESELAMAMSASGALDRARNYAELRISGKKLTPSQRKDFQQLSDQLFGTATSVYNSKRNELAEQGSAFGLNADRALGAPAKMPSKNIKVSY